MKNSSKKQLSQKLASDLQNSLHFGCIMHVFSLISSLQADENFGLVAIDRFWLRVELN
jgi:hypothetical protein